MLHDHQSRPKGITTMSLIVKAALVSVVILTMRQITMCNVKGAACSDKPTGNCD